MMPTFNTIHKSFKLNGKQYCFAELKKKANSFINKGELFEQQMGSFLIDWLNDNDFIIVKTSGSTGTPKSIRLQKQAMVNSAIATGVFFNLKPGHTALLCLPVTYIAGKMMLIRAMVLGLEIDSVQPTTSPVFNTEKHYDFCAMIPVQAQNTSSKLTKIKTLIIGGAPMSFQLKQQLKVLKIDVFETYGMTETITHIAVKQLKGEAENYFKTLPNITISQNKQDCLVIEAPQLTSEKIVTNDVVKLHSESTFEWLGRQDNVINSGGVKLFPEQIEAKLRSKIDARFFIASEANQTFGDVAILVLEANSNVLDKAVFAGLPSIEIPKKVYAISAFAETSSGKINRLKTIELLKK